MQANIPNEFLSRLKKAKEEAKSYLVSICFDMLRGFKSNDYPTDNIEEVKRIEALFKPTYGPVSFYNRRGQLKTTKAPVRIAPLSIMVLEKIGADWNATASASEQIHGVLAPISKHTKYHLPYRNNPTKPAGEAEIRLFLAYVGREWMAEFYDMQNNPVTNSHAVNTVLTAEQPTNLQTLVDRSQVPLGGARPIQIARHIQMCCGFEAVYEPEFSPVGDINSTWDLLDSLTKGCLE